MAIRGNITAENVALIGEPIELLAADNPWLHRDALPGKKRGAVKIYEAVMDVAALQRLPLPVLARDCTCLFWRLANMLPEALAVLDTWGHEPGCRKHWMIRGSVPLDALRCDCGGGFTIKAEVRWRKIRQRGKRHFGMGHYVRATSEVAMLAVRGHMTPEVKSLVDELDGEALDMDAKMPTDEYGKLIHSAKPDEFYTFCDRLAPRATKCEIFARVERPPVPPWWQIGNELGGKQ